LIATKWEVVLDENKRFTVTPAEKQKAIDEQKAKEMELI